MPLIDEIRGFFSRRKPAVNQPTDPAILQRLGQPRNSSTVGDHAIKIADQSGLAASHAPKLRLAHEIEDLEEAVNSRLPSADNPVPPDQDAPDLAQLIQRCDQLGLQLDRLPEAINTLPELNRQVTRLLEVLASHLSQIKGRDDGVQAALRQAQQAIERQSQVLGLIQQEVDSQSRQASDLAGVFRETINELVSKSTQTHEALNAAKHEFDVHRSQSASRLKRMEIWLITALFICVAAAATGVWVAITR